MRRGSKEKNHPSSNHSRAFAFPHDMTNTADERFAAEIFVLSEMIRTLF
jgi:hypothetical protein